MCGYSAARGLAALRRIGMKRLYFSIKATKKAHHMIHLWCALKLFYVDNMIKVSASFFSKNEQKPP